jgi:uncharacterized membrane protein (UPF0127 family)
LIVRRRLPRLLSAAVVGLVVITPMGRAEAPVDAPVDRPPGALPLSAFPQERIAVETRASFRRRLFLAWRAETYAALAQGLMYVPDAAMRPDQAMIFVYDPPQRVSMWMKNTLLSLDMLFVDRRGCIVTIKERAVPRSLVTIESRTPVALVVELKAGTVASQGIAVGDRVVRIDADWPPDDASCR